MNLRHPWGNCSEWELDYFETYSMSTCKMERDNKFIRDECKCRDAEMLKIHEGKAKNLLILLPLKTNPDEPCKTALTKFQHRFNTTDNL